MHLARTSSIAPAVNGFHADLMGNMRFLHVIVERVQNSPPSSIASFNRRWIRFADLSTMEAVLIY